MLDTFMFPSCDYYGYIGRRRVFLSFLSTLREVGEYDNYEGVQGRESVWILKCSEIITKDEGKSVKGLVFMMIDQQTMEKYAVLALRTGVNLQQGQALMINAPVEGADFTRVVVKKAYELGAKDVHVQWN